LIVLGLLELSRLVLLSREVLHGLDWLRLLRGERLGRERLWGLSRIDRLWQLVQQWLLDLWLSVLNWLARELLNRLARESLHLGLMGRRHDRLILLLLRLRLHLQNLILLNRLSLGLLWRLLSHVLLL